MPESTQPLKRPSDFCRAYGVAPVTVWRWVRSGRLPTPIKIGNRSYWPAETEPLADAPVQSAQGGAQ